MAREDQAYDVFVSYAGAENKCPVGAPKGWVSAFVQTLTQELGKTRIGKRVGVNIWWDEKDLDPTGSIKTELQKSLVNVPLLVVLLSRSYLESDWCRQELNAFLTAVKDQVLGNKRVFLVDTGLVPKEARPDPLQPMLGFRFHDDEGVKLGYPYPNAQSDSESHSAYFRKMLGLAEKIAQRLEEANPSKYLPSSTANDPVNGKSIATIYLAETTDNLDALRNETATDFRQHDFRVVPEKRLASDLQACRQQITKAIAESKARIFVQLLEPALGKCFDESTETMVTLQHQIAREQNMTVLQWRGPNVDISKLEGLVKSLLGDAYVSADPLETFKAEVRRKAVPANPAMETSTPNRPAIYVQSDQVDEDKAKAMAELISEKFKVVSRYLGRSNDPETSAKRRNAAKAFLLDLCDAVVIFYGKAKVDWVEDRIEEFMQLKAKRSRPLRLKVLYYGPPTDKENPTIIDPDLKSIDATLSDEINVTALEPLIKPLFGAVGG